MQIFRNGAHLIIISFSFLFLLQNISVAQDPDALLTSPVEVAKIKKGEIIPTTLFVGTVFYPEVSSVASEAEGKVDNVAFEEGTHVNKGDILVTTDSNLLAKEINAIEALIDQSKTELKKATKDFLRYKPLVEQGAVSKHEYDKFLYTKEALFHKTRSLKAQSEKLKVKLAKKIIHAPFSGVILSKKIEKGEWLDPGDIIAELARDNEVDIIVSVPEKITAFVKPGQKVDFKTAFGRAGGRIITVIPKGDIKTRTFPVKIRADNALGLLEGMEARVNLPSGPRIECFTIPRDGIASMMGKTAIIVVSSGTAHFIPVKVTGYTKHEAGISGKGLRQDLQVVIKGNERLQDGQPVKIIN